MKDEKMRRGVGGHVAGDGLELSEGRAGGSRRGRTKKVDDEWFVTTAIRRPLDP
jgi:hypothetical protein